MKQKNKPAPGVVLRTPKTALAWLVLAKGINDCLVTNKAMYPAPNPPTATLSSDIAALDAAELATHTRALGAAEARDASS